MARRTVLLSTGHNIPMLGLGTWQSSAGQVKTAVLCALEVGYRNIDCAFSYGNEHEVGEALQEKVGPNKALKREDVFIVSKLWNTKHHPEDVEPACRLSLANLQLQYLDLYLMHWPIAFKRGDQMFPKNEDGIMQYADTHFIDTWKAMEHLVNLGLVRAIGLSNFNAKQVDEILAVARHKPVVNQVECHPYLNQKELLEHCRDRGIILTAYSPLGSAHRPWAKPDEHKLMDVPQLLHLARKYGKSPAQLILRWQLQRGVVCIPKSSNPSRIEENFQVFDFTISDEDMENMLLFHKGLRLIIPVIERDGKPVWRDAGHPHFPFHEPY
ncbi:aldo-keto reductase family 1 member A1-A-like [Ambystoma mexicanum]|uniref:aldo-keto reductase family 1 member A1-A-like n=1 Tax=Ambystoma mexicanum TaxID=8296 RepID=UPI0037E98D5F